MKLKDCCPEKLYFETLFKYGFKFNDVIALNKKFFVEQKVYCAIKSF